MIKLASNMPLIKISGLVVLYVGYDKFFIALGITLPMHSVASLMSIKVTNIFFSFVFLEERNVNVFDNF